MQNVIGAIAGMVLLFTIGVVARGRPVSAEQRAVGQRLFIYKARCGSRRKRWIMTHSEDQDWGLRQLLPVGFHARQARAYVRGYLRGIEFRPVGRWTKYRDRRGYRGYVVQIQGLHETDSILAGQTS